LDLPIVTFSIGNGNLPDHCGADPWFPGGLAGHRSRESTRSKDAHCLSV